MCSQRPNLERGLGSTVLLSALLVLAGCTLLEDDPDPDSSRNNLGAQPAPGDNDDDAPAGTVCGLDVLPSPASVSTNPCEEGETVLSETIVRKAGEPNISSRSFDLEAAAELCVTLHGASSSGDVSSPPKGTDGDEGSQGGGSDGKGPDDNASDGKGSDGKGSNNGEGADDGKGDRGEQGSDESETPDRGSGERNGPGAPNAVWVYVDGEKVAGPSAFARSGATLQDTLEVEEGSHRVEIRVASKPGTSVDLDVKASEGAPSTVRSTSDKGFVEVRNVAVDHPLFSPNGDGYHDTTIFNADNEFRRLPRTGQDPHSYRLEWQWRVISADSCERVEADLSGSTPLETQTNVRLKWDGTTRSGGTAADGNYVYRYRARLVRSDGKVVDRVVSHPRGLVLDTSTPDLNPAVDAANCDPNHDTHDCTCPGSTPDDTRCRFAWITNLETFERPSKVSTSSFLTAQRTNSGRWEVVVDLRDYNGGGLVPQGDGEWENVEALQDYIHELTGVPPDPNDVRLFNFDYTQLGYSIPVVRKEGVRPGFNHFLLDVITDSEGRITIDGETVDLERAFASNGSDAPDAFQLGSKREGEQCGYNGNTDGARDARASSCTQLRTANLDPNDTNLGIYIFQKQVFDVRIDGAGTNLDEHCVVNGIFKCGVRTMQRTAEVNFRSRQYVESEGVRAVRDLQSRAGAIPALVEHTDRHVGLGGGGSSPIDGICSSDTATAGGLSIPLDSGAGALPPVCVVNGIF